MLNWKIKSHLKTDHSSTYMKESVLAYQKTIQSEDIGFFRLPQNRELLKKSQEIFQKFSDKKFFIHIGIGGSALGPEMLLSALGIKTETEFIFINNVDPDDFSRKLQRVNLKDSIIYVVSKSGTTAETVAALSIIIQMLKKSGITEDRFKDFFVFCTDPKKGDLKQISNQWSISTLDIPSNIGGRFSVLTPVGLFPSLFAGINALAILEGAESIQNALFNQDSGSKFFDLAFWIKDLYDKGINQTVMMPYSSLLKDYSSWFVQLWAESLGKNGKGLTPIPAFGATDQHSQMQLFMEGPENKLLIIIEIEKFLTDFSLTNEIESESFKNLSPFKLTQLFKAELEGTLSALEENKKHVAHLKIPFLDEKSLGQLILFAECLTVMVGELIEVNPFNQPGVEAGKKFANEWLRNNQNSPIKYDRILDQNNW